MRSVAISLSLALSALLAACSHGPRSGDSLPEGPPSQLGDTTEGPSQKVDAPTDAEPEAPRPANTIYRAELAYQLERRSGLVCQPYRTWFELAGVPRELVEEFSKRRQEIDQVLASHGWNSPQAAAIAALAPVPLLPSPATAAACRNHKRTLCSFHRRYPACVSLALELL